MLRKTALFYSLLIACISLAGCAKSVENQPAASDTGHTGHEHDHSGWWCVEHGVPEEVCALCSSKTAADFKAKGDWCTKHDRPESQCFVCQPGQQAKFAAQYEAKFGEQPPKPTM
jgi:hypothetical protein